MPVLVLELDIVVEPMPPFAEVALTPDAAGGI